MSDKTYGWAMYTLGFFAGNMFLYIVWGTYQLLK